MVGLLVVLAVVFGIGFWAGHASGEDSNELRECLTQLANEARDDILPAEYEGKAMPAEQLNDFAANTVDRALKQC